MLFFSQVLVGVHESSAVFSLGLALILFAYILLYCGRSTLTYCLMTNVMRGMSGIV